MSRLGILGGGSGGQVLAQAVLALAQLLADRLGAVATAQPGWKGLVDGERWTVAGRQHGGREAALCVTMHSCRIHQRSKEKARVPLRLTSYSITPSLMQRTHHASQLHAAARSQSRQQAGHQPFTRRQSWQTLWFWASWRAAACPLLLPALPQLLLHCLLLPPLLPWLLPLPAWPQLLRGTCRPPCRWRRPVAAAAGAGWRQGC